jgi:putative membrane protein insertion efficiency factor
VPSALRALARAGQRALGALLLALIAVYRRCVSPFLGARCRFYPSCSAYAEASIRHYGPFVGLWRAARRLLRCHPFHPGGFDPPVPLDDLKGHRNVHG